MLRRKNVYEFHVQSSLKLNSKVCQEQKLQKIMILLKVPVISLGIVSAAINPANEPMHLTN